MSQKTLKTFQKRLTNLGSKNKSLFLPKAYEGQFLDFSELDYAGDLPAMALIEWLLFKGSPIKVGKILDSRSQKNNELSRSLRKLYRRDRFIFEESGLRNLRIGYPFLEGQLQDGAVVRAPLLFIPVEITEQGGDWYLARRAGEDIGFNQALLLAYSHFNQVKLEDDFLEQDFEAFTSELKPFLTELYRLLEDSPMDVHFNAETFADRLESYHATTLIQLRRETKTGVLKQYPQAVLGVFPQNGSYLATDYVAMQDREITLDQLFGGHLAIDNPIKGTVESKSAKEEELKTIFPLDAWQEKALRSVKAGESIVVQGPPGSGKSQLICNLVSDAIAQKKNVLVVCQKRAALDVVAARLKEKGFARFAGLVHDHQADRSKIYNQINEQIGQVENYKLENSTLDVIFLERDYLRISRDIDRLAGELDEFRSALFEEKESGVSAKELYLNSDLSEPIADLRNVYREFKLEQQQTFSRKLRNYLEYARTFKQPNYPLRNRLSFASLGIREFQQMRDMMQEVPLIFQSSAQRIKAVISMEMSLEECLSIHENKAVFDELKELLENQSIYKVFQQAIQFQTVNKLTFQNHKRVFQEIFDAKHGVETQLPASEVIYQREKVEQAIIQHKSWYSKIVWQRLSNKRRDLEPLLMANGLDGSFDSLVKLARRLDNRLNLEHQLTKLKGLHWTLELPKDLTAAAFTKWFDQHIQALEAKEVFQSLRNTVKYVNAEKDTYQEFTRKLDLLQEEAAKLVSKELAWSRLLSKKQLFNMTKDATWADKLIITLERDFEGLCAFDRMQEEMAPYEQEAIEKLMEAKEDFEFEKLNRLFLNSIRIAWIEHLEAKFPVLRLVSSGRLDQMEYDLRQAITQRQELSHEIAKLRAKERVYDELEFNRLKNMVTYRDLKHQVNKKRQIFPLRKLVNEFEHELFKLIPCWLASPEMVSAVFPLDRSFDLVIFDEASQCFAEKGLPALMRGKQSVICGDSKQLAPLDLFRPVWEEDAEGDLALEVESLLDLATRMLPTQMLKGHYRSRSPELIDFSNRWFYNGELRMLPDLSSTVQSTPSITYLKVAGVWQSQTNESEARAVLDEVRRLVESGEDSIGVITFNQPQQELVMDMIDQAEITLPDSFFVKNIENVQGDERDIILFTIGYAPSSDGKFRAQFGLLNQEGGKNRLNVAITRAKTKVIVIASLLPSELKLGQVKSEGPHLLKKYLEYAHQVSNGNYRPETAPVRKHAVDWYLKQKIASEAKQFGLKQELPFSDLAKLDDGKGWLLMTDDDLYFQAMTAKNAHAYLPAHLESKGWRFKRMYSREYWRSKEDFWQSLERFLYT